MSKCTEIREICGDYAFDVEYAKDFTFTMFFNSRRNAETVKRCVEVDDSIPNVATAVDFVEVVRCKDCKHCNLLEDEYDNLGSRKAHCLKWFRVTTECGYCSFGEKRREEQ